MTNEECEKIVNLSKQINELSEAKITIQKESNVYLGMFYHSDFYTFSDVCIIKFSEERKKIAEQWIEEDLKSLKETLTQY